jgi:hypothetical protein
LKKISENAIPIIVIPFATSSLLLPSIKEKLQRGNKDEKFLQTDSAADAAFPVFIAAR